MPDMSAYQVPKINSNTTNNNNTIQFNVTINGNADQNTVAQFKDVAREIADSLVKDKRFQEGVTNFVNRR